jgi:predicted Zn-dependent peptidase
MEQARLLAVFSGLPPYFSGDGMSINVLNSMFGGDSHSLLFDAVREKQSLAYSVFSSVLRYVGGVAVYAGVAPRDIEKAMETVSTEMERLATGAFDATLFDNAVTMVRTQLLTLSDSLAGLLGFYTAGLSNGRLFQVRDALRLLADVTPAHIAKLASPLRLSSLFVVDPGAQVEDMR